MPVSGLADRFILNCGRTKMNYTLIDNKEKNRFEFHIGEQIATVAYFISNQEIYIPHVNVPKNLEGQGIASALVLSVLKNIEERNLKLIPICSFLIIYLKRHPEWKKLLVKSF